MRTLHLASYDISQPRRLRAALAIARRFASGGQKSVHECWLDTREHALLLWAYRNLLDLQHDRVLVIRVDPRRPMIWRGAGRAPAEGQLLLVL